MYGALNFTDESRLPHSHKESPRYETGRDVNTSPLPSPASLPPAAAGRPSHWRPKRPSPPWHSTQVSRTGGEWILSPARCFWNCRHSVNRGPQPCLPQDSRVQPVPQSNGDVRVLTTSPSHSGSTAHGCAGGEGRGPGGGRGRAARAALPADRPAAGGLLFPDGDC